MTIWRLILMAALTAGITFAPLAEAVAKLNAKTPIGARLRSAEWENMPLALRERGQWSANVESVKLLATIQDKLTKRIGLLREQVANGDALVDRSSFIADIRAMAEQEGVQTTGKSGAGTVRDIRSSARLGLIFDQQTRSAAEFANWKTGQDADVLDAFPCQELIRVEERQVPRQWASRWQAAGGKFYEGRMIARKDSPVWTRISRFGTPWPPFDFGSGMGVEDVSRDEAERLGVITASETVAPQEADFNASLQASVTDLPHEEVSALKDAFGDQLQIKNGKAVWQGNLIGDLVERVVARGLDMPFDSKAFANQSIDFGKATLRTVKMASTAGKEGQREGMDIAGFRMILTPDNVYHIMKRHAEGRETRPDQRGLTSLDLQTLPQIWRYPDFVEIDGKAPNTTLRLTKVLNGIVHIVDWNKSHQDWFMPTSMVVKRGE